MSTTIQNINYRAFDRELYNIALKEWNNYRFRINPDNDSSTIITFGSDYIISVYPLSNNRWLISMKQTINDNSINENIVIREGNRCGKSEAIIIFLWSLFANFSNRNTANFSEREHNLYCQLGNFFYFEENKWKSSIDKWKAMAKTSIE